MYNITFTMLHTESMGGALCPKPMISQFSYEYLQGNLRIITGCVHKEPMGGARCP